ncbi:TetR/AcrR family transcriptional regulator [Millisia brevis]|uniref:TetR/AcrR family transcriptional regulator n=1 Tax=Millisia brevis TaxID=264148 RepID=UPI000B094A22|nr:TetR/AcrR family transcriptional regulator [Millisia brevis]
MSTPSGRAPRNTLSMERLIDGAIALIDEVGLDALTVRTLATRMGVTPMALYHHVANKDELLNRLVDAVFADVYAPTPRGAWSAELARRSRSLRTVLRERPWALRIMESRPQPGPATIANHEAVLDCLRTAGFTWQAVADAYATLDAFVYGFALQESMLAAVDLDTDAERVAAGMDLAAAPRMAEFAAAHVVAPGYAFGNSFEVGLGIVLDGIARLPGAPEPDAQARKAFETTGGDADD